MASSVRKAANRTARREEAVGAGIKVTIDGTEYTVHIGEVSAVRRRMFREQVGVPFSALFARPIPLDPVDIAAAVEWMARMVAGETLTFDQVAGKYELDKEFELADAQPDPKNTPVRVIEGEVDDRPEA